MSIVKPKFYLVIVTILLIFYILNYLNQQQSGVKYINGNYRISKSLKSGFIINSKNTNYYVWTKQKFYPNDIIYIKGIVKPIDDKLKNYFRSINTFKTVFFPQKISFVQGSKDFRNSLSKFIDNQNPIYANLTNLLLLGRKTIENKSLYDKIIEINIVHLFVISGFHFGLIYLVLKKFFGLFTNEFNAAFWTLPFLIFYAYILRFSIPAQRSLIFLVLTLINKRFGKKYSNIFSLNITMLTMICLNFNIIFSHSFYLTFYATYILIIINEIKFKNKFHKAMLISFLIYFSFMPYTIYLNGYMSIFGILFGYLFIPIIPIYYGLVICLWWTPVILTNILISLNALINFSASIALKIKFSNFSSSICKISYATLINLFIIYTWLNYYMEKKHT